MDSEKKCSSCGSEIIDGVCPQCSPEISKKESASGGSVRNTTGGWCGTTQPSSKKSPSGGFCNR